MYIFQGENDRSGDEQVSMDSEAFRADEHPCSDPVDERLPPITPGPSGELSQTRPRTRAISNETKTKSCSKQLKDENAGGKPKRAAKQSNKASDEECASGKLKREAIPPKKVGDDDLNVKRKRKAATPKKTLDEGVCGKRGRKAAQPKKAVVKKPKNDSPPKKNPKRDVLAYIITDSMFAGFPLSAVEVCTLLCRIYSIQFNYFYAPQGLLPDGDDSLPIVNTSDLDWSYGNQFLNIGDGSVNENV